MNVSRAGEFDYGINNFGEFDSVVEGSGESAIRIDGFGKPESGLGSFKCVCSRTCLLG